MATRHTRCNHSRRALALASLTAAATLIAPPRSANALVAFPGAQGFGANSTGGRGGDVYHVTTLADDPNHVIPGSLFYGLYEKNVPAAGRTIVFDVGGTISLGSTTLDIKNISKVTIAGQTAPSPITIIGNTVQVTSSGGKVTSNIILQHVAIRKGLANSGDCLTIKGSGDTHDIIADHISGSWSEDEVISVAGATNHSQNVTVQNSTMSEALTSGHQYGALIRNDTSESVSYTHNLFSNNVSRNPRPGTYLNTQLDFEFQNNVIYNYRDRAGYTGGASESDVENVNMNYVGNYIIAGPSTTASARTVAFTKDASNDPLNLHVYQNGNLVDSNVNTTRDGTDLGWGAFVNWNGVTTSPFPAADENGSPFSYATTGSADSADIAYQKMIASVGAFPWARTTTDQRLINEVLTNTGVSGQTAPNTTEWNAINAQAMTSRPAGWDTDNDGMPNWYETLRGYNPSAADNNTLATDGYTRLEHYLQYLTAQANWNLNADGNWSDYMNWRGDRPQAMDSTANFIAGTTAPRTVNIDMPVSVGQMSFDGTQAYTLAGASAITMDVVAGSATIDVAAGSHTISAPLNLADDTIVTVQPSSTLTISNLQASTKTITKAGTGTLVTNGVRAHALVVNAGTVQVAAAGGTTKLDTLTVANGAKLDVNNNKLVTHDAVGSWNGTAYTGVTGLLAKGANGGDWSGTTGIITTQSNATGGNTLTSLAVAKADDVGYAGGTFGGVSVASGDTLVMYTYAGDANLDGQITGDDYFQIDSAFPASAHGWINGDFNYDGVINGDDYFIIDSNFPAQGAPFPTSAAPVAGVIAVPEPAALSLAALATLPLLRRRRTRRKPL